MGRSQRLVLVCSLAAVAGRAAAGCSGFSLDDCHQRMIAELGCCPGCDADCREQVIGGCERDAHERPLEDDASSSTETSDGSGEPSPAPFD